MEPMTECISVYHPSDDCYTFYDGEPDGTRYFFHKSSKNVSEYTWHFEPETTAGWVCSSITKNEWLIFKHKMQLISTSIRALLPDEHREKNTVYMPSADRFYMFVLRLNDDTFIAHRYMFAKVELQDLITNIPVLEERINRYFKELLNGMQLFINKIDINHEQDS